MNTEITAEQLNRFVELIKNKWADNSVEAVVGLLSTVISANQLDVLIDDLEKSNHENH